MFSLLPIQTAKALSVSEISASYIFNFLHFIDWPKSSIPALKDTYMICIVGDRRLYSALKPVNKRTIGKKKINVKFHYSKSDLKPCHVVFLDKSLKQKVFQIVKEIEQQTILLISDNVNFSQWGGIIGFGIKNQRVYFDISLKNARKKGFKIKSNLLELAHDIQY